MKIKDLNEVILKENEDSILDYFKNCAQNDYDSIDHIFGAYGIHDILYHMYEMGKISEDDINRFEKIPMKKWQMDFKKKFGISSHDMAEKSYETKAQQKLSQLDDIDKKLINLMANYMATTPSHLISDMKYMVMRVLSPKSISIEHKENLSLPEMILTTDTVRKLKTTPSDIVARLEKLGVRKGKRKINKNRNKNYSLYD